MARQDYPVYVHWYRTLDPILSRAEAFPRNARFSLGSRVADAGMDVMEGIVRAIYTRDRGPILAEVNMKLEWLRVLFRIAHDRRYLSTKQYEDLARRIDEAGRMVGGWSRPKQDPQ
jgi:hypothetical protein